MEGTTSSLGKLNAVMVNDDGGRLDQSFPLQTMIMIDFGDRTITGNENWRASTGGKRCGLHADIHRNERVALSW